MAEAEYADKNHRLFTKVFGFDGTHLSPADDRDPPDSDEEDPDCEDSERGSEDADGLAIVRYTTETFADD